MRRLPSAATNLWLLESTLFDGGRAISRMVKKMLKWLLEIVAVLLVAAAIFLINLIWFRPWSLNLFYEKVFAQVLFEEPEMLSGLGLVEPFGITGRNAKLGDESPAHQQRAYDRGKQNLADLRAYSLARQTPSQRLSTHILDWFIDLEVEGEKYQWHNYPVNQMGGVQNGFPTFNFHRAGAKGPAAIPKSHSFYRV